MKQLFLGNLATKLMALLLAVLTWTYLFTQDRVPGDIEVQFNPILELPDLAWTRYTDAQGRELKPGTWMSIRISGPKGAMQAMNPRSFTCTVSFNATDLKKSHDSHTVKLERKNFKLPEQYEIEGLDSMRITLEYARYVERTIELEAGRLSTLGEPRGGYQVNSITATPPRIQAKVRADRAENIGRIPIQKVRVEDRVDTFTLPGSPDLSDPRVADLKIVPLQSFSVVVEIVPVPKVRRITVDLNVSAPAELLKRIALDDRTVAIEVRGPEELVRAAPEAAFFVYAVVTAKDLDTPGPKNISEVGCHILDPRFRELTVEIMPDRPPKDRQVKITVSK